MKSIKKWLKTRKQALHPHAASSVRPSRFINFKTRCCCRRCLFSNIYSCHMMAMERVAAAAAESGVVWRVYLQQSMKSSSSSRCLLATPEAQGWLLPGATFCQLALFAIPTQCVRRCHFLTVVVHFYITSKMQIIIIHRDYSSGEIQRIAVSTSTLWSPPNVCNQVITTAVQCSILLYTQEYFVLGCLY